MEDWPQFLAAGGAPSAAAMFLAWQVSRLRGTVDEFRALVARLTERQDAAELLGERRNSEVHERIDSVQRDQLQFCESRFQQIWRRITIGA